MVEVNLRSIAQGDVAPYKDAIAKLLFPPLKETFFYVKSKKHANCGIKTIRTNILDVIKSYNDEEIVLEYIKKYAENIYGHLNIFRQNKRRFRNDHEFNSISSDDLAKYLEDDFYVFYRGQRDGRKSYKGFAE